MTPDATEGYPKGSDRPVDDFLDGLGPKIDPAQSDGRDVTFRDIRDFFRAAVGDTRDKFHPPSDHLNANPALLGNIADTLAQGGLAAANITHQQISDMVSYIELQIRKITETADHHGLPLKAVERIKTLTRLNDFAAYARDRLRGNAPS